tara:strand:+ start:152 stop:388 length:237 start_codon:yes stop_codon:yes gene_type:complete
MKLIFKFFPHLIKKIIYLEILDEKDRWDLKFKKIDKFMKKNNFKFFKSSRIIEGSILSTLKIVDVIYINKYSIYNLTH